MNTSHKRSLYEIIFSRLHSVRSLFCSATAADSTAADHRTGEPIGKRDYYSQPDTGFGGSNHGVAGTGQRPSGKA